VPPKQRKKEISRDFANPCPSGHRESSGLSGSHLRERPHLFAATREFPESGAFSPGCPFPGKTMEYFHLPDTRRRKNSKIRLGIVFPSSFPDVPLRRAALQAAVFGQRASIIIS